jgi:hypothetical protein
MSFVLALAEGETRPDGGGISGSPGRRLFGTHLRRGALCTTAADPVVRYDPRLACGDRRRRNAF